MPWSLLAGRHMELVQPAAYHHGLLGRGVQPADIMALRDQSEWHPAYENRFFRGQIHRLPEEHCKPAFLAERAVEFIHSNRQRPWVLFANFLEPHPPNTSCRDDQYDPADVTLHPNWNRQLSEDQPRRLRRRATPVEDRRESEQRKRVARYWGMNSLVDTYAGRILDALDAVNGWDETIIVLTSDHGDMLGSFGLGGKSNMLDEASRVPMLIHAPGQTLQRKVSCPVSQVDLVPTLLDMMGQPEPTKSHGQSLRPVVEGAATETDRDVFLQWGTRSDGVDVSAAGVEHDARVNSERIRTIVTRDCWKLNVSSIGDHELYDLQADPYERNNRYNDPGQADHIRDLRSRTVRVLGLSVLRSSSARFTTQKAVARTTEKDCSVVRAISGTA